MSKRATVKSKVQALKSAAQRAEERQQWAWDHAHEVYEERDLLVRALSCVWPAHLMPRKGHQPRDGMVWTVCIHAPVVGQLAWRVPESLLPLYAHLDRTANDWDGHKTTDRKARLKTVMPAAT